MVEDPAGTLKQFGAKPYRSRANRPECRRRTQASSGQRDRDSALG